jgi:sec-independent protein translocase protein TatA
MHTHLAFLNVGGPEMVFIFALSLLLFGAERLPKLARGIGKSVGEFQKARQEFEYEITRAQQIGQLENKPADEVGAIKSIAELEKELAELKALKEFKVSAERPTIDI